MLTAIDPDLVRRYDVPAPRYTSYPTVPAWSERFGAEQYGRHLQVASEKPAGDPLSLYVHLPFCRERCTFCGCNVVISKDWRRADRYIDYLDREMAMVAERLGARRQVRQLHFGGGTPTFLSPEQLTRVFGVIREKFVIADDAELAIEIDPRATNRQHLETLAGLGFNRLSLGVQDLNEDVQMMIGRYQSQRETLGTLETARAIGFSHVNMDLIYGLPGQTPESWQQTIEHLITLAPQRVALYGFAYVPLAKPHQGRLKIYDRAEGMEKLALFRAAAERLQNAGWVWIGMDHFARPEDELAQPSARGRLARNFQGYTVRPARDTVAFGATAISEVAGGFAQNVAAIAQYYKAIDEGRLATERGISLSAGDVEHQSIIEAIMCNLAVELGPRARERFPQAFARLEQLEQDGLVEFDASRVQVTPLGRLFLRNVASVFDEYLRDAEQGALGRAV